MFVNTFETFAPILSVNMGFHLEPKHILHIALNFGLRHGFDVRVISFPVYCLSHSVCVLQDALTDLSAESENLPIEGVSGACYAHKVNVHLTATPLSL